MANISIVGMNFVAHHFSIFLFDEKQERHCLNQDFQIFAAWKGQFLFPWLCSRHWHSIHAFDSTLIILIRQALSTQVEIFKESHFQAQMTKAVYCCHFQMVKKLFADSSLMLPCLNGNEII